jgi:hypothetical protein
MTWQTEQVSGDPNGLNQHSPQCQYSAENKTKIIVQAKNIQELFIEHEISS